MHWWPVTLVYVSYLAATSLTRPAFARARGTALTAAVVAWLATGVVAWRGEPAAALSPAARVAVPALVLLAGYWLSGLFFTSPDSAIEQRLLRMDGALLARVGPRRWSHGAMRFLLEWLELSYLLVYALLPAGAVVVAIAGQPRGVARFWTVVLLAEFSCYAVLPWIQTRPPRVLEDPTLGPPPIGIRRFNLVIASRVSIQANTLPSAHTAGAVAAAQCVTDASPAAGAVFMVMAASIGVATVAGRYHYLVDSVLGVLVGVAAWALVP